MLTHRKHSKSERQCYVCKNVFPLNEHFFPRRKTFNSPSRQFDYLCKKCKDKKKSIYRRNKISSDPNFRTHVLKVRHAYEARNKERLKQYRKQYNQKNQENKKKYSKEYRKKYPEKYHDYIKRHYHKNTILPEFRYRRYKQGASIRDLEFSLSFEDFKEFWQKNCFYCNSLISTIGLDRIDNTLGYTKDNLVSCCIICNRMKNKFSYQEFIHQCLKIAENQKALDKI